jgi:ABC transporter transmembrane region
MMSSADATPSPEAPIKNPNEEDDEVTNPLLSDGKIPMARPEPNAWKRLTFQWFTPILKLGNEKQRLEQEDLDLVPLPESCRTDAVHNRFDFYWREETKTNSPSLVRALYRAFGRDYIFAGLLKFVHDLSVFVGPITLHNMVVFLRSPDAPLWHGLFWTTAVTCSQILMSICLRHYFFQCYQTGLRIRTALAVAVYRKALRLAAHERQTRSAGEITNLMSIDAQRLQGTSGVFVSPNPLDQSNSLRFCTPYIRLDHLSAFLVVQSVTDCPGLVLSVATAGTQFPRRRVRDCYHDPHCQSNCRMDGTETARPHETT